MTEPDDIDRELAALGRATKGIQARPGFSRAVMQAIEQDSVGLWGQVTALAWRWVPVAAAVAAVALVFAIESEAEVDDELATAYGAVEVDW